MFMYYYAVLNTKDIVEYISEQETEVTYYEYISIPTSDQSLVGKWYDREGVYGTVGAFLEVPISIQAEHSSSQINYKGQDVWLDEKLDSYATQSDLSSGLSGKANLNHFHDTATQTSDGYMSSGDKAKLDGIEANANLYVHPDTHAASMITGLSDVAQSGSYNDLTDRPTIPTIPTALPADGGNADTLDGYHAAYFASGQHNHDAVYAPANHTHDYAATYHTHENATTSEAGFMSAEDKTKLNGIASGANNYTHPASHPASMITETDSLKVMTAAERTKLSGIAENANNYTHPETHSAAIIEETSLKKVMTAEERTKLAGIESGANNYSHPSTHPATMITGLSSVATSGSYDDLSNKPTSMSPTAHTHAQSEIAGLETALSGKASSTHTHAQSEITGLETALAGKASTNHTEHNGEIIANKVSGAGITLQSSYGKTRIHKNSSASSDYGTIISDYDTDGKRDYLQLRRSAPSAERKLFLMSESAEDGTVSQYKIYGEHNKPGILWSGVVYPGATSVVTFSKTLSECRGGILLLWSDYDPDTSTASNNDFVTTIIPRMSPTGDNWNGESFYCDIPRYIGSDTNDVTTESRIIKRIKVYNNKLEGYVENARDVRTDVVLRAVFEY